MGIMTDAANGLAYLHGDEGDDALTHMDVKR